jgi:thiol-disulfide isomerase/thioredoxin
MSNIIQTVIENRTHFAQILEHATKMSHTIVVKFGADWCGPCKRCHQQVHHHMTLLPPNFVCFVIDVDEFVDVYAFLKSKKVVNGIPTLLAYSPGSIPIAPTYCVTGSDPRQIDVFFEQIISSECI